MVMDGTIEQPLFAVRVSVSQCHYQTEHATVQITLQRDTIDISGNGQLTIGELPSGIDNSSLTWVPVRLYTPDDGGLQAPTFASGETYPLCVMERCETPKG